MNQEQELDRLKAIETGTDLAFNLTFESLMKYHLAKLDKMADELQGIKQVNNDQMEGFK